jgi:hypothetical protein
VVLASKVNVHFEKRSLMATKKEALWLPTFLILVECEDLTGLSTSTLNSYSSKYRRKRRLVGCTVCSVFWNSLKFYLKKVKFWHFQLTGDDARTFKKKKNRKSFENDWLTCRWKTFFNSFNWSSCLNHTQGAEGGRAASCLYNLDNHATHTHTSQMSATLGGCAFLKMTQYSTPS